MARLDLGHLGQVPAEHRCALDPRELSVGVVHLGLGAFHRAHQLYCLERAAELSEETRWAVSGFSQRRAGAAEVLTAQDGLFSLRLAAPGTSSLRVLASLREARFAQEAHAALAARLADPRVALVTLTVTEKGYRYDPASGRLARQDPALLADAAGGAPTT
ncbi:MAG: mannitol dehydrogenase family protein, partial [Acidimicrobiales bacterium]